MEVDSAAGDAARGGWNRDMDGTVDWAQELPESGGGMVTEYRPLTASENCRHPSTSVTERVVADRVDAAMNAMQASLSRSFRDSHPPEPHRR